jgi:hypothetical protein
MHPCPVMSPRSHLALRLGALALLACAAMWPRTRTSVSSTELSRGGHDARAAHAVAARVETTAARLAPSPRTAKVLVAQADDSLPSD